MDIIFTTLTCFVTKDYQIAVDGVDDKSQCLKFGFDLEFRRLNPFLFGPFSVELRHDAVARNFFDQLVGTPEKLIEFVRKNQLSKTSLTALLEPRIRIMFLSVCAILEKDTTKEKCLKACVDIWADKFQYPENRIEVWRN